MSALWQVPTFGDEFIETGLGHGETLSYVVQRPHWKNIVSMDIDKDLVSFGRHRFQSDSRVQIHGGNSLVILPRILNPMSEVVFWLDSHDAKGIYSADAERGAVLCRASKCPLLEELDIITRVAWKVSPTILIDDWALCGDLLPPSEAILDRLKGYKTIVLGAGMQRYLYAWVPR